MTTRYLLSAVQIGEEKLRLKKLFYSVIAISFCIRGGRLPCLHVVIMPKLGQEPAFEFRGSSGKMCVLPLPNGAVCRRKKEQSQMFVHVTKLPFPKWQGRSAITFLLFLGPMAGLHPIAEVTK